MASFHFPDTPSFVGGCVKTPMMLSYSLSLASLTPLNDFFIKVCSE